PHHWIATLAGSQHQNACRQLRPAPPHGEDYRSYRFAKLVLTAGLRKGAGALTAAASLARRCARNRAVFRRVASSFSICSFQAAAPAFACSSLRKCLLALRTAALSCSAILGSPSGPQVLPRKAKNPRVLADQSKAPKPELCRYIRGQSVMVGGA